MLENDQTLTNLLVAEDQNLTVELELHKLIKVEDWFKDGSTIKRVLRKGKGASPQYDSNVKCTFHYSSNLS